MQPRPIRMHEMEGGREFVFQNDAEAILFRCRMAVAMLAVLLALLVFRRDAPHLRRRRRLIALGLLAFDPTLLRTPAWPRRSTGQALFLFGAVYAFYRHVQQPTPWRLAAVSLIVGARGRVQGQRGAALPHAGAARRRRARVGSEDGNGPPGRADREGRLEAARVGPGRDRRCRVHDPVGFYGFRYEPADGGVPLVPSMEEKLAEVPSARAAHILGVVDRLHLPPRGFTYGFAHAVRSAGVHDLRAREDPSSRLIWSFFPVSMPIKSSLTFLILLAVGAWAVVSGKGQGLGGVFSAC